MTNYYELLGVPHNASPAVVKIAYEGKMKALAGLPEAERMTQARELERACVTLSNPAKRQWYDAQLEKLHAEKPSAMRAGIVTAVLAMLVSGGAVAWYFQDRARTREAHRQQDLRIQAEQERVALERERDERAKELERARAEQAQVRTQRVEVRVYKDERDMALRERSYNDSQAFRAQAQKRTLETFDRREQERVEDRNRRQADEDRRKALAEVERQKRFVRERELEDERARVSRDQRAQQDRLDRQRREAIEALKASH